MTKAGEIQVGEKVFVQEVGRRSAPRLLEVESVATQSFVVDGARYRKDRMERKLGADWGARTYRVVRLSDPEAPKLAAQRKVAKALSAVSVADTLFNKEQTAELARDLAGALETYAAAVEELEARRSNG